MKRTRAAEKVAAALMADPDGRHWGYALWKQAGVRSGVLYPILLRMLNEGWLSSGREDPPPEGRPPRRYYEITKVGRTALAELAAAKGTSA